jgi:hypothetical protein
MSADYKAVALQMNRLYCIGEGHLASDLLLDAIRNDDDDDDQPRNDNSRNDFRDYVLFTLDQIRKNLDIQLATLTSEIEKWIKTQ